MIDLATIDAVTGGRLGRHDVACPLCGPERRSPVNRRRPVLRVWRIEASFASFHCARCGERGFTRDHQAPPPDPVKLARARAEAAERERVAAAERLSKARWLWSRRQPIAGTIAETYLRRARCYGGPLPATLGFLPARGKHGAALLGAFGLATEPEPGRLAIADDEVRGVHITRLAPDGSGKTDKIAVGLSRGWPIVLAPVNDGCGLVLSEGIEDGLSAHEATGLGAWAAGSWSRLPALADVIPPYVETLSVLVDDDRDGRKGAAAFADHARARGVDVRLIVPNLALRAAA